MFEDVFIELEEARKYQNEHPCCQCDSTAKRVLSAANFQFTGAAGQSGACLFESL